MPKTPCRQPFRPLLGKLVVLDTDTSLVYLGTLTAADDTFITLEDADVHDMRQTSASTPKEAYILEARRHGVQRNRHRVHVKQSHVISLSILEDVVVY